MKNLRILVIGAEGVIGNKLCDKLEKSSANTVIRADIMHTHRDNYHRVNIANFRQIDKLLKDTNPDIVYLLAAEFGRENGESFYEQVWDSNCKGTQHILEIQKDLDFKLIFASSSEVYGELKGERNIESEEIDPAHNTYALSKYVGEKLIRNYHERCDTKTMTLRIFNMYGEGEYYTPYRSVVCKFCYNALKWRSFTVYMNHHRSFIYQADVIKTLAACSRKFKANEIVNIGGSEYRSVEELADIVLDSVDASVWYRKCIEYVPEDKYNVINKRPDNRKAEKLLGHNPTTPLEIGVPNYIRWLRKVYEI